jgi:hypothetical protein
MAEASERIAAIRMEPTPKQRAFLERHHRLQPGMTRQEASAEIGRLIDRWRRRDHGRERDR